MAQQFQTPADSKSASKRNKAWSAWSDLPPGNGTLKKEDWRMESEIDPEDSQAPKAPARAAGELMSLFHELERTQSHKAALTWAASLEREEVLIIANELRTGRQAL